MDYLSSYLQLINCSEFHYLWSDKDRLYPQKLGVHAVELLLEGTQLVQLNKYKEELVSEKAAKICSELGLECLLVMD